LVRQQPGQGKCKTLALKHHKIQILSLLASVPGLRAALPPLPFAVSHAKRLWLRIASRNLISSQNTGCTALAAVFLPASSLMSRVDFYNGMFFLDSIY
jgi:hypothetical protein